MIVLSYCIEVLLKSNHIYFDIINHFITFLSLLLLASIVVLIADLSSINRKYYTIGVIWYHNTCHYKLNSKKWSS